MKSTQQLTKATQQVANVVSDLAIDPKRDTFKITGNFGVISAHVRKADGEVVSLRIRARGALRQVTKFDAKSLKEGLSQAAIADLLGVSQATVCLDLKRAGKV